MVTRRDVLVASVSMVGTFCASAILARPQQQLGDRFWGTVDEYLDPLLRRLASLDPIDKTKLRLIAKLFGDRADKLQIIGGRAHYGYPKTMHPDDLWACEAVVGAARQLGVETNQHDSPFDVDAEMVGSFLCTGSPVSNAATRLFMEYRFINPANPAQGLCRSEKACLRLPFEFLLDSAKLESMGAGSHHPTKGVRRANWSLVHKAGILQPNTNEGSDYLLVSRLPNWIEGRTAQSQDFVNGVTILAGTHGVGTGAVRLLLDNLELLSRLGDIAEKYQHWQAVIRVDGISAGGHPYGGNKQRKVASSICSKLVAAEQVVMA